MPSSPEYLSTQLLRLLESTPYDFASWLESQMHEEGLLATPLFSNLFGGGGNDNGITTAVREAIEEASNSGVDTALNGITPDGASVADTPATSPALKQLPPVTPVVSTALSALRAAASASGAGGKCSSLEVLS